MAKRNADQRLRGMFSEVPVELPTDDGHHKGCQDINPGVP